MAKKSFSEKWKEKRVEFIPLDWRTSLTLDDGAHVCVCVCVCVCLCMYLCMHVWCAYVCVMNGAMVHKREGEGSTWYL